MARRAKQELEPGVAALAAADADFARVVAELGPPPSRKRDPGFGTLLRAIVYQQVSTAAGAAIWGRLEAGLGEMHHASLLRHDDEALRGFGLSRPKVKYARALATALADGTLDLDGLHTLEDEAAITALVALPGIGRWTAEVYLLSALDRPDVMPAADLALMVAAQHLKGLPERPTAKQMYALSEPWRPWRSVAARLLWHYYRALKNRDPAP
ncbi:MAG: DNA-3-methyladenine glycosylase 2 family protein [Alphaproteobacteria bacterium]